MSVPATLSGLSFEPLALPGLGLVHRRQHRDARGAFARLYCQASLDQLGIGFVIRQINHSITDGAGTVRGMHFQRGEHAEAKLITCLEGSVFDVAVDVRPGSPTFLHWQGVRLEAGDARAMLIPRGFAHGFQVLSAQAQLLYLHSADYSPGHEAGLSPLDPALAIEWPHPVVGLSPRDQAHPLITADFSGAEL